MAICRGFKTVVPLAIKFERCADNLYEWINASNIDVTRCGVTAGRTALLRCVKDCSIAVYRAEVSSQSRNATGLFALDPV